jgi:hypothetical protein
MNSSPAGVNDACKVPPPAQDPEGRGVLLRADDEPYEDCVGVCGAVGCRRGDSDQNGVNGMAMVGART